MKTIIMLLVALFTSLLSYGQTHGIATQFSMGQRIGNSYSYTEFEPCDIPVTINGSFVSFTTQKPFWVHTGSVVEPNHFDRSLQGYTMLFAATDDEGKACRLRLTTFKSLDYQLVVYYSDLSFAYHISKERSIDAALQ